VLLIRADGVVTTGQLMTEIWGDDVPRRAMAGIHVYISQLRKFLHRPGRQTNPIMTLSPGYALQLGADEFDVNIFAHLVAAGQDSARAGCYAAAANRLEEALSLWHGPVPDFRTGPIFDGFVTWLTELRIDCLQGLIDAQLNVGLHREVIGRLYSLIAEHPLRETFYRQLMMALYRSERQADALDVYRMARRVLIDELGLEPCRSLQELHTAILRADDRLDLDRELQVRRLDRSPVPMVPGPQRQTVHLGMRGGVR
jgi:DNA-binding SARP family transcriptional activator